jgi:hypothetical protein
MFDIVQSELELSLCSKYTGTVQSLSAQVKLRYEYFSAPEIEAFSASGLRDFTQPLI